MGTQIHTFSVQHLEAEVPCEASNFPFVNGIGRVEHSVPLIAFFLVFQVSSLGPMVIGVLEMTTVRVHVEEI